MTNQHIRLAVTGFSGSGKTVFVTALVKHLTSQTDRANLSFFDVVREQRLIAVKQIPQRAPDIPIFDYNTAIGSLLKQEPDWPESTQGISTLTLALKYQTRRTIKKHISAASTLRLELIDYPGEWLGDLPMLNQSYQQWSDSVLDLLNQPQYKQFSAPFLSALAEFNVDLPVEEVVLKSLATQYGELLSTLKAQTAVAQLQPGRMLVPGKLADAPVLRFFPCPSTKYSEPDSRYARLKKRFTRRRFVKTGQDGADSQYAELQNRFNTYKHQVIKPFYKQFCRFDRQLVLVDVLAALNDGYETFRENQFALRNIMNVFDYGKSRFLWRSPKIDKVLFTANKCDHVNLEQQPCLTKLLHSMLNTQNNELRFSGVEIDTMAVSAVQSTIPKQVKEEDSNVLNCIYGKPKDESQWITYLPPQPPEHNLTESEWPPNGYDFLSFSSLPAQQGNLKHVHLDHVLQFLIGDKLQ